MGVQGLWQLLEPVGRPVNLEALENKILAIDASIWLHQAVHGYRDKSSNPLPNAHLLGLFNRICKLLFYGIKPVFVFDGAVPFLKKQTMARRRDRQQNAARDAEKTYQQILHKYLQSRAIKDALGDKTSDKSNKATTSLGEITKIKPQTADMYDLPPVPSNSKSEIIAPHLNEGSDDDDSDSYVMDSKIASFQDVDVIDVDSKDFLSLPLEIQHELLVEMKERNKRKYWIQHEPLPEDAEEIGNFQIRQVLYRRKIQKRIEAIKKELNESLTGHLAGTSSENDLGTYFNDHIIESKKISSEDSAHYILFKNIRGSDSTWRQKSQTTVAPTRSSGENIMFKSNNEIRENLIKSSFGGTSKSISGIPTSPDENCSELLVKTNANQVETTPVTELSMTNSVLIENILDSNKTKPAVDHSDAKLNIEGNLEQPLIVNKKQNLDSVTKAEHLTNQSAIPTPSEASNKIPKKKITAELITSSKSVQDDKNYATQQVNEELKVQGEPDLNKGESSTYGNKSSVQVFSSSDDESDDFLEVVVNPDNVVEDELFPLEIFQTAEKTDQPKLSQSEFVEVATISDTIPSPPAFAFDPTNNREDLLQFSEELDRETETLLQDKGRQERIAATITQQMYIESQELLKLFGIPYVVSPAEAEAQCATMDELHLTDGTITDDSDVWLFGARRVYKNFFERNRDVLFFSQEDVQKRLSLDRSKLIAIAFLTGSDYTDGIKGVGIVTALEILAEFKEADGFKCLRMLSSWWKMAKEQKVAPSETKVKQKLRGLTLSDGFPSEEVRKAYLEPLVDSSKENFSWAQPDIEALRHFAYSKLGWTKEKTNEQLMPLVKRLTSSKERQVRIDSFFPSVSGEQGVTHQSMRLKRALNKVRANLDPQVAGENSQTSVGNRRRGRRRPRGRGSASRGRTMPSIAENAKDLGLSESSDSESSEEEWNSQQSKRKRGQTTKS